MPQLDIYILCQLVLSVLIFWSLLFLLNLNNLLINIFLSLKVIKIKFFIEKQLLKKIFKELYFIKNIKYIKKIITIITKLFLDVKKKIFTENILDIYNTNINIYNIKLKKKYKNNIISKNNLELYRNFL
jgi:hypothetical protein